MANGRSGIGRFRGRALRSSLAWVLLLLVVLFAPAAFANQVTPRPEVRHGVTVREEPRSDSARVGVLKPGDRAHFLSSVPSWHEIRLPDGSTGFVPKRWTVVTDATAPVPFEVHFVDVGTGDAAILDVGTGEMIIDGGNSGERTSKPSFSRRST
jgi:beta-lactamase superfamily II metal-dependent hydrolase